MKKVIVCAGMMLGLTGAALMSGCDWSSGSTASTWSASLNSVNFNGTYVGTNGMPIVSNMDGGATNAIVTTLTVWQDGENLLFTDNNGTQYSGRMGEPRGTGAATTDTNGNPVVTGDIIAQFSAEGVNGGGVQVKMVGTFKGSAGTGETSGASLSDRTISGTWIENGNTGDLFGVAR